MSQKANNNPTGINQHKLCSKKGDEHLAELLRAYFKRNITNRLVISELLEAEHNIKMSQATVARRCDDLGLHGSGKTTRQMSETDKRQLVLDQMSQDLTGHRTSSHKGGHHLSHRSASDSTMHH